MLGGQVGREIGFASDKQARFYPADALAFVKLPRPAEIFLAGPHPNWGRNILRKPHPSWFHSSFW